MKDFARKFISLFAALALTFCMLSVSGFAASADIAVSVSAKTYKQDDEVTVKVYFPKEYKKVCSLTMRMTYDSKMLEVVSVAQGKGLKKARDKQSNGEVFSEYHGNAGTITWCLAGGQNYDFTDDFAEIVFKVKSYAEIGECKLDLIVDEASNTGFVDITKEVSVSGASFNIIPNILNNLTFKLNSSGTGYVITEYLCMTYDTVSIPDTYKGLPIVGIEDFAFKNHTEITSLTLPNSLQYIGSNSFSSCSGIKELNIPVGVTEIGESAFEHCTGLEKVTLPVGLATIGMSAFASCIRLTSIELPFTLTKVGALSFSGCYFLNQVKISKNTVIEKNTFNSCADDLKFITVKDNTNLTDYISSSGISPEIEYVNDISLGSVSKISNQQYTAEAITPTVKVTLTSGTKVTSGNDYNVVYVNNTDIGTAKIYVAGINGYGEGYEVTFKIVCGHSDVNKTVSKKATCTATGKYTVICNICGNKSYETIPANGHKASTAWTIDTRPTITKEGKKHQVCTVCKLSINSTSIDKAYPDVNNDGKINSSDALILLQYSVGMSTSINTDEQFMNADTNGDGKVNSFDALTTLKIAVNLITI